MRRAVFQLAVGSAVVLLFAQSGTAKAQETHSGNAGGSSVYQSDCSKCHGDDGGGSAVGKSLHAPDLRSSAVQMKSDAELERLISDGNGAMPAFQGRLSDQQILDAVRYIRVLGKHNEAQK